MAATQERVTREQLRQQASTVVASIFVKKPLHTRLVDLQTQLAAALAIYTDDFIWSLYRRYKDDPMVKWKDSIKQVVGLDRPTVKGLDI